MSYRLFLPILFVSLLSSEDIIGAIAGRTDAPGRMTKAAWAAPASAGKNESEAPAASNCYPIRVDQALFPQCAIQVSVDHPCPIPGVSLRLEGNKTKSGKWFIAGLLDRDGEQVGVAAVAPQEMLDDPAYRALVETGKVCPLLSADDFSKPLRLVVPALSPSNS